MAKGKRIKGSDLYSRQTAHSRHKTEGCRGSPRPPCEGNVGFPVEGIGKQGGGGNCGSELMQMGGAGSSRGSPAKPSVQRSRRDVSLPALEDEGVAGRTRNCVEC